jgi:two-component system NarL family sensor kinase
MTHDLKTPTIAQIRALELLAKNTFGELNKQQLEIVNQIMNSCKYMYDLIFSILDTYLYDNGQTKINYEKFDIAELVSLTINEILYLSKEKEQNILISNQCTSNEIVADKFQIKRVIINLLSNAITYGDRQSDILLKLGNSGKDLILSVENKGAYIPEDKISEMFLKYKSKENAKFRKTGTGLGLYLAKQIINAHNGHIYASSTKDCICTVGFSIPLEKLSNKCTTV